MFVHMPHKLSHAHTRLQCKHKDYSLLSELISAEGIQLLHIQLDVKSVCVVLVEYLKLYDSFFGPFGSYQSDMESWIYKL